MLSFLRSYVISQTALIPKIYLNQENYKITHLSIPIEKRSFAQKHTIQYRYNNIVNMIFTVLLLMMVTSSSEKIPSNVYIPRYLIASIWARKFMRQMNLNKFGVNLLSKL